MLNCCLVLNILLNHVVIDANGLIDLCQVID
jgi:hypothetical protein